MTSDEPTPKEEVLAYIEENITVDDPTVAMGHLFDKAEKKSYNSRDELIDAYWSLAYDDGKIATWMWRATLAESEYLRAWAREEAESPGFTRRILVGKMYSVAASAD